MHNCHTLLSHAHSTTAFGCPVPFIFRSKRMHPHSTCSIYIYSSYSKSKLLVKAEPLGIVLYYTSCVHKSCWRLNFHMKLQVHKWISLQTFAHDSLEQSSLIERYIQISKNWNATHSHNSFRCFGTDTEPLIFLHIWSSG